MSDPAPKIPSKKFEVCFPAEVFHKMEAWRAGQMTRSKFLVGATLRLLGAPIPLQNRRAIGFLCLKCGATSPLTQPIPAQHDHAAKPNFFCRGVAAVVVE